MASLLPSASSLRALTAHCAALLLGVVSGCGVRLDDGSTAASAQGAEQGSAANQPASSTAPPDPEAALGTGPQRVFALAGSVAHDLADTSFLQCGFRELWSLRFEGLAFERFQELSLGEECDLGGCFFALAGAGDLSARGRFGQAREYARELTVTRVSRLERVRRATDLATLNSISCTP